MSIIESLSKLGLAFWTTIVIGVILLRRDRTDKQEE